MAQMTWKQMLDEVEEVRPGVYVTFAQMFKDECNRLAAEYANKPLIDYNEACNEAAVRIARNLFALTFA